MKALKIFEYVAYYLVILLSGITFLGLTLSPFQDSETYKTMIDLLKIEDGKITCYVTLINYILVGIVFLTSVFLSYRISTEKAVKKSSTFKINNYIIMINFATNIQALKLSLELSDMTFIGNKNYGPGMLILIIPLIFCLILSGLTIIFRLITSYFKSFYIERGRIKDFFQEIVLSLIVFFMFMSLGGLYFPFTSLLGLSTSGYIELIIGDLNYFNKLPISSCANIFNLLFIIYLFVVLLLNKNSFKFPYVIALLFALIDMSLGFASKVDADKIIGIKVGIGDGALILGLSALFIILLIFAYFFVPIIIKSFQTKINNSIQNEDEIIDKILKYNDLLNKGIITEQEFNEKKSKLLKK